MSNVSGFVLVERIRVERWDEAATVMVPGEAGEVSPHIVTGRVEVLRFSIQHPSHNPAHGAIVGGPPVIHTETIMSRDGDLGPLIRYLNSLLPKMGES